MAQHQQMLPPSEPIQVLKKNGWWKENWHEINEALLFAEVQTVQCASSILEHAVMM